MVDQMVNAKNLKRQIWCKECGTILGVFDNGTPQPYLTLQINGTIISCPNDECSNEIDTQNANSTHGQLELQLS